MVLPFESLSLAFGNIQYRQAPVGCTVHHPKRLGTASMRAPSMHALPPDSGLTRESAAIGQAATAPCHAQHECSAWRDPWSPAAWTCQLAATSRGSRWRAAPSPSSSYCAASQVLVTLPRACACPWLPAARLAWSVRLFSLTHHGQAAAAAHSCGARRVLTGRRTTGAFRPGRLTTLMGASGAGKARFPQSGIAWSLHRLSCPRLLSWVYVPAAIPAALWCHSPAVLGQHALQLIGRLLTRASHMQAKPRSWTACQVRPCVTQRRRVRDAQMLGGTCHFNVRAPEPTSHRTEAYALCRPQDSRHPAGGHLGGGAPKGAGELQAHPGTCTLRWCTQLLANRGA